MKRVIFVILLIILLLQFLSGCTIKNNDDNNESSPRGDSDTAESIENSSLDRESENTTTGIVQKEYPAPKTVYGYDSLTTEQKTAYNSYAEIVNKLFASTGSECITVPLKNGCSPEVFEIAISLYNNNFFDNYYLFPPSITYELSDGQESLVEALILDDAVNYNITDLYNETIIVADTILSQLEFDGTEQGKVLSITNWLIDNVEYADDYSERYQDKWLWSAYGALVKGEAVCGGYAKAFDLLCKRAGLTTIYVEGATVGGNHAWNMIKLQGEWYHIDVTFMDTLYTDYDYFMTPDKVCFSNKHMSISYCNNYIPAPKADSFTLYRSYHGSCESTMKYFQSICIDSQQSYFAAFEDSEQKKLFFKQRGEIITDKEKKQYYIRVEDISQYLCLVNFIEVRK